MTLPALYSIYIKRRDGYKCRNCGRQYFQADHYGLDCSHFFGKANKTMAFEPDNGMALCHECHMMFHAKGGREKYTALMESELGVTGYNKLTLKRNEPYRLSEDEQREILNNLLQELE
jgi:hypothetical protein